MVDVLLSRGLKVRGTTRSSAKGEAMIKARPEYSSKLDFIQTGDFETGGGIFTEAVKGVDAVIHVASVSVKKRDPPPKKKSVPSRFSITRENTTSYMWCAG